ncbi:MAG: L-fucose mutarotase [Tannerella sp.]|jgi:L-fucose mutarotase|nr:L-fucose mutarotase [Tannerella sp.]
MLKGISGIISPDLLKNLAEMGHGDEIVFGDSNFPAATNAQRLIRADGHTITDLLQAILPLFPLDYAVDYTAILMKYAGDDEPKVWSRYREILAQFPDGNKQLLLLPRFDFYERARQAYCIVATSESEAYANLIITKGVVR